MPTMVFNYDKEKIEQLDKLAQDESRTRSSYIQKVLFTFLQKKGIAPKKKKTIKLKKK